MELRRGVMVTPKFLALVFPVRIGAAQQKNGPLAKLGYAQNSKFCTLTVCRFDSGKGHENGPGRFPGT